MAGKRKGEREPVMISFGVGRKRRPKTQKRRPISKYIHTYIFIITGVQASGVIIDRLL